MIVSPRPLALAAAVILCAGCYDFEQTIVLRPDLSGSISIVVTIHQDENEPGTSRDEFLEQRDDIVRQMKEQSAEQIPEGVRLSRLDLEWLDEHRSALRLEIEFDHVQRLQEIKPPPPEEGEEPEEEDSGLPDFEITEESDHWHVRTRLAEKGSRQDLVPKSAYEGRTFVFTLQSQAKVMNHNGEAVGPDVRWARPMTEIVDPPSDLWAEWDVAKD